MLWFIVEVIILFFDVLFSLDTIYNLTTEDNITNADKIVLVIGIGIFIYFVVSMILSIIRNIKIKKEIKKYFDNSDYLGCLEYLNSKDNVSPLYINKVRGYILVCYMYSKQYKEAYQYATEEYYGKGNVSKYIYYRVLLLMYFGKTKEAKSYYNSCKSSIKKKYKQDQDNIKALFKIIEARIVDYKIKDDLKIIDEIKLKYL